MVSPGCHYAFNSKAMMTRRGDNYLKVDIRELLVSTKWQSAFSANKWLKLAGLFRRALGLVKQKIMKVANKIIIYKAIHNLNDQF